jgi:hypothetical protein
VSETAGATPHPSFAHTFARGDLVKVRGFSGVACRVAGPQMEPDPSEWYDDEIGEWVYDYEPGEHETGRIIVVMVGDDHRHVVDPEDCTPISDHDFCRDCGQTGCTWNTTEES